MTEDVEEYSGKDSEEDSESGGEDNDCDDTAWVEPVSGGRMGGGSDDDDVAHNVVALPLFEITDDMAHQYNIHKRTAHYMERHPISLYNHAAVKAVYMVEALTLVKTLKMMKVQGIYTSYSS